MYQRCTLLTVFIYSVRPIYFQPRRAFPVLHVEYIQHYDGQKFAHIEYINDQKSTITLTIHSE